MHIAGRPIGPDHPPFIICELSGNHNGSLDRALALIDAAAATGCDAIKIQSYTPDTITLNSDGPDFRIQGGLWDGRTLYDLYGEAHTPFEWHQAMFDRAAGHGVILFSTPFDDTAVDMLERLGAPAYKIASFELTDLELIRRVARTGKPMIISTGLGNTTEIAEAVDAARTEGCEDIAVLHCVSSYPAPDESTNLLTIPDLARRTGAVVGLSDHTHGTAVSVASVALGARVIEKHFTLCRADGGPDAAFSLEPDEFKALCDDCRTAFAALGQVDYSIKPAEEKNIIFRRSIYTSRAIRKGEVFSPDNIRVVRPGYGLPPKSFADIVGNRATRDIDFAQALSWDMVEK